MKNWLQNGLVGLSAAAILAGGYFGMDIAQAVMPAEKPGTVVTRSLESDRSALVVDRQEGLTFYPWTLYDPRACVPLSKVIAADTSGADSKAEEKAAREELNRQITDALLALDDAGWRLTDAHGRLESACEPANGTDFFAFAAVQEAEGKAFFPRVSYTSVTGENYRLDMVMDKFGRWEALHVRPQMPTAQLDFDAWQEKSAWLEEVIARHRENVSKEVEGMDEAESDRPGRWTNIPWGQDVLTAAVEVYLQIHPREVNWEDYSYSETVNQMMDLIDGGDYQMVYYESEILLFFLPRDKGKWGLLLYVDPEREAICGYHLLDLTG
ncbi:MAG: hypothetical protein ACOYJY_04345 [Acutalibacteraceae bacterium]|jgi:hypothetical protein